MARRRTVGYVQLEWTCPNCSTRNPGGKKTCVNCGAPQPDNVQFEQPVEGKFITEEKAIQAARAGADIHCGFCGTRNPATAKVCSQCGGDLKEGMARQSGRVMAAPTPAARIISCTNCGIENPASNTICSNCAAPLPRSTQPSQPPSTVAGLAIPNVQKKPNWLLLGGIAGALLACCLGIYFLFVFPTSTVQATVSGVHWQTSIPVEEVRAVDYNNERGSPPSDAYHVSCDTQSRDVCEQKTIDKGNGYAEVVEDCHTETDQYCDYTRDEWTTIQTYTLDGYDYTPVYEQPSLASGQRIGNESVVYKVSFDTEKGAKEYNPKELNEFRQFHIGESWTLNINALGAIVSVNH